MLVQFWYHDVSHCSCCYCAVGSFGRGREGGREEGVEGRERGREGREWGGEGRREERGKDEGMFTKSDR